MTWLLDTNACIAYLRGRSNALKSRLEATSPDDLAVCSVVRAELLFGAALSNDPVKTRAHVDAFLAPFASFPFDDAAATLYAKIRADLSNKGSPIGPNDLLIAAICMARDATLVTHNVAEFSRVAGLKFNDWQEPASS